MIKKFNCSYCGKPLRDRYSFSLGIPGILQTFKCDRRWCTIKEKIKQLLGKIPYRVIRVDNRNAFKEALKR